MKRIISIFLTLLVLLAAVHPTLALHYCGDNLHSIKVLAEAKAASCCAHPDIQSERDAAYPGDNYLFSESMNGCCSFYYIEMSTDDFQQQAIDSNMPKLSVAPICDLSIYSILQGYQSTPGVNLQTFPPGDIFREGGFRLSIICTYLI